MKVYNLFLGLLLANLLLACSSDDVLDKGRSDMEYTYDATLSLSIADTQVDTKADDRTPSFWDPAYRLFEFVKKLNVAVFSPDGKLLSFGEKGFAPGHEFTSKDVSITKMDKIKTVSGNVKLLVIANYDLADKYKKTFDESPTECATLDDYKALTVELDNEINGSITMSSDLMNISLQPGNNEIGKKNNIVLYRNVARIHLGSVAIDSTTIYSKNAMFTFNSIFVANVKSQSRLFSPEEDKVQGSVELGDATSGSSFWYCGKSLNPDYTPYYPDMVGNLKSAPETGKTSLCYDLVWYRGKFVSDLLRDYPFLNGAYGRDALGQGSGDNPSIINAESSDNTRISISTGDHHYGGGANMFPIGVYFYCYENMKSQPGYQTLLVLRGTYSYTEMKTGRKISSDCYYTITVNKPGTVTDDGIHMDFNYVRRNYIYAIGMVLKGPGSKSPFEKDANANVSFTIKVKDWNVKDVTSEVN